MAFIEESETTGWYVVRTKPKQENLAALSLRKYANLDEVFSPRIKFERKTMHGKKWFVEAMFPSYIFARFDIGTDLRTVNATHGVLCVLRFADSYPTLPDSIIQELRDQFKEEENELIVIEPEIEDGQDIVVIDGALKGLETIVTRFVPGDKRVHVLMDILGEEREVAVDLDDVKATTPVRENMNWS
ncbi:MAG: transcription termination/antitermination NusG family protein [Verrucomicrobiota bacterium]